MGLEFGQSQCRITGIPNLSPIPLPIIVFGPVVIGESSDRSHIDDDFVALFTKLFQDPLQVQLEDFYGRRGV